jgi:malate/lactate dehydrogenase
VPVTDVALQVVGQLPGNAAVLWEQGLVAGVPAVQRVGGGAMRRVESRLEALWPPAPYALASAAAAVIRCVLTDARKTMTCTTLVPRTPVAVARPARLGRAGIVELVPFPETTRLRSLLG